MHHRRESESGRPLQSPAQREILPQEHPLVAGLATRRGRIGHAHSGRTAADGAIEKELHAADPQPFAAQSRHQTRGFDRFQPVNGEEMRDSEAEAARNLRPAEGAERPRMAHLVNRGHAAAPRFGLAELHRLVHDGAFGRPEAADGERQVFEGKAGPWIESLMSGAERLQRP